MGDVSCSLFFSFAASLSGSSACRVGELRASGKSGLGGIERESTAEEEDGNPEGLPGAVSARGALNLKNALPHT